MTKRLLLLLAGLAAGMAIGAFLGWVVWPVQYYDTDFSALHPDHQLEYVVMVGAAYELDGDWERVEERLGQLQKENVGEWLRDSIHRAIAEGQDPLKIRHLISLAEPLGVKTEIMEPFSRGRDG